METIDSMKRVIAILAVAIIALGIWSRFSATKPVTQKSSGEGSSKTNATGADKLSPRLRKAMVSPENDSANSSSPNETAEEWKKLSREEVDAYLLKTKRSPESLLNAFVETGDTNFLAEAAEKYPDNPIVQWAMVNQKTSPEERQHWLEKLKTSSPDNALPNYLSALDKLKAGNTEQALAEIDAGSKKMSVNSFERERQQSREEMYLLAGYSPLEARSKGMETVLLPNLSELKALAQEMSALQQKYLAAGDSSSAQQLAALGLEVGGKVADGKSSPTLINQLVGYAMENIALKNLDAGTYYDFLGKTAGERIQEIKNQKQEIKDLTPVWNDHYVHLSDTEKMIFLDRSRLYGELNAMKWLKRTYGRETR
jgi:hypothetical protein